MSGPEHYQLAEGLSDVADDAAPNDRAELLMQAQVHATLALAAATAVRDDDKDDWLEVTKPTVTGKVVPITGDRT